MMIHQDQIKAEILFFKMILQGITAKYVKSSEESEE